MGKTPKKPQEATGQTPNTPPPVKKDASASALGGAARAKKMSKEKRIESARKAAKALWGK